MKSISIKEEIKEYFFINPTDRLRVRNIEKKLNLPLPSVIRYVKDLEKEEILKSSFIANIKLYSANRTSRNFLLEKKFFNIRSLYNRGLIDFLIQEYDNPVIIVFGSYAKGEDTEKSDIDIYIETSEKTMKNISSFEKKLNRTIQIFKYKSIKSIENKELANNIINGFTINGFLEVFK